jgi:hypothetical protein
MLQTRMEPLIKPGRNIYGLALTLGVLFSGCLFFVALGFGEPTTITPVILLLIPTLFLLLALIKVNSRNPAFPIIGAVGASAYPLLIVYAAIAALLHPSPDPWLSGELAIVLCVCITTLGITITTLVLAILKFKRLRNPEVTPWQQ